MGFGSERIGTEEFATYLVIVESLRSITGLFCWKKIVRGLCLAKLPHLQEKYLVNFALCTLPFDIKRGLLQIFQMFVYSTISRLWLLATKWELAKDGLLAIMHDLGTVSSAFWGLHILRFVVLAYSRQEFHTSHFLWLTLRQSSHHVHVK